MSPVVTIPNALANGTPADGSQVRANDDALAAVLNAIDRDNLGASPNFPGTCISTVAGERVPETRLEDDAVSARVLKSDSGAGSANAAVGSADHIVDGIIPGKKLRNAGGSPTGVGLDKLEILYEEKAFSFATGGGTIIGSYGVSRETSGANYQFRIHLLSATGAGPIGQYAANAAVTPTTAIPTASRKVLFAYIANPNIVAGNFTGTLCYGSILATTA